MAWLMPAAGPVRHHLAATIDRLAAEHNAPRFEPHVTMAGLFHSGEEAAAQTLISLTAGARPFEVRFAATGHEQAYFRALYLRAEPSPQLTALHEAARAAWALESRPYMPHLSLLYADIAEEHKRAIIDALGIQLPLTIRVETAELWANHPAGFPAGTALRGCHSPRMREKDGTIIELSQLGPLAYGCGSLSLAVAAR